MIHFLENIKLFKSEIIEMREAFLDSKGGDGYLRFCQKNEFLDEERFSNLPFFSYKNITNRESLKTPVTLEMLPFERFILKYNDSTLEGDSLYFLIEWIEERMFFSPLNFSWSISVFPTELTYPDSLPDPEDCFLPGYHFRASIFHHTETARLNLLKSPFFTFTILDEKDFAGAISEMHSMVGSFLLALSEKIIYIEKQSIKKKLRKKFSSSPEFLVNNICKIKKEYVRSHSTGESRNKNRLHQVRGHTRHYSNNTSVFIKSHKRGSFEKGVVLKQYKL